MFNSPALGGTHKGCEVQNPPQHDCCPTFQLVGSSGFCLSHCTRAENEEHPPHKQGALAGNLALSLLVCVVYKESIILSLTILENMKTVLIFSILAILVVWCYVMWKKQNQLLEYMPENQPKIPQFKHIENYDEEEHCDVCEEGDD